MRQIPLTCIYFCSNVPPGTEKELTKVNTFPLSPLHTSLRPQLASSEKVWNLILGNKLCIDLARTGDMMHPMISHQEFLVLQHVYVIFWQELPIFKIKL